MHKPSGLGSLALNRLSAPFARFLRFELLDSLVLRSPICVPECPFSRTAVAGLPSTDSSGADVATSAGRVTAELLITGELEDCELKAPVNWELEFGTDAGPFPRFRLVDKRSTLILALSISPACCCARLRSCLSLPAYM